MPNFSRFNAKNIDGHWFRFDHQQMGNSCGPASAKIVKESYHNQIIGEGYLRGVGTLSTFGASHQGHSALSQIVKNSKDWEISPTNKGVMLDMLKSNPLGVTTARQALGDYVEHLKRSTRNRPTIIGWLWKTGGGHFNVCVGPTKKDRNLCTILDPALGIQYLNLDDRVGNSLYYRPILQNGKVLEGSFTAKNFEPFIITY
ncbi:hypothetical protein TDB9533_00506 [Thalassocella blandensis]|nr:hypothetical protein TDB9533_00506 [Thalassocella blandensis]